MYCFPLTCPLLQCKCFCLSKCFKFVEMSECLDVFYLLFAIASAYFSGTGGGEPLQVFKETHNYNIILVLTESKKTYTFNS
jgi:hypothetical protein